MICLLPLTHASKAIRTTAFGGAPKLFPYLFLALIGGIFFWIALWCVNQARD